MVCWHRSGDISIAVPVMELQRVVLAHSWDAHGEGFQVTALTQARIANLERELAHARAENERLRLMMKVNRRIDARQIRELEQAVQNLLHVTVPLVSRPFDSTDMWSGSFVRDKMKQLKEPTP